MTVSAYDRYCPRIDVDVTRRCLSGARDHYKVWLEHGDMGIMRSDCGLQQACEKTERMAREIEVLCSEHRLDAELVQLRSLATVAQLIVRSARQRLESRGVHYNCDYPARDDDCWQRPTLLVKDRIAASKIH